MAFEYARCTKLQGSWLWYWSLSGGCKSQGEQAVRKFDGEKFNLRKVNELEIRKQYQVTISALENLNDDEGKYGLGKH